MLDSLAGMEIRLRLMQSELADVHKTIDRDHAGNAERNGDALAIDTRLDNLQHRLDVLPGQIASLCPEPPTAATVNTQCEREVQRVVVSGDKLVVGQLERVWVDPPSALLVARIDAAADHSLINARDVVEFERDGNKWVRFEIPSGEETLSVERPLKRLARVNDEKRPMVALRVQLGDVRETVEFALMDLSDQKQSLVLGRNFLTDVALVDVARKYVQPASRAPSN